MNFWEVEFEKLYLNSFKLELNSKLEQISSSYTVGHQAFCLSQATCPVPRMPSTTVRWHCIGRLKASVALMNIIGMALQWLDERVFVVTALQVICGEGLLYRDWQPWKLLTWQLERLELHCFNMWQCLICELIWVCWVWPVSMDGSTDPWGDSL